MGLFRMTTGRMAGLPAGHSGVIGPFASGKWPHGHTFTRPKRFLGASRPNSAVHNYSPRAESIFASRQARQYMPFVSLSYTRYLLASLQPETNLRTALSSRVRENMKIHKKNIAIYKNCDVHKSIVHFGACIVNYDDSFGWAFVIGI